MGKIRAIDTKIRKSQTYFRLTYRQRDLWHGLIESADDQGRMPGLATYIRSAVWPYDDISIDEIDKDIQVLLDGDFIMLYEKDGDKYLQIINWWKYQSGAWAGKSDHPEPDGWIDRCRYHGKGNNIVTKNWDSQGGFKNQDSALHSRQDSPLPCNDDDVNDEEDVNDDGDGKDDTSSPATFISQFITAVRVQFTNHDQPKTIQDLVDDYGEDVVLQAATWYGQNNPRNMGHALKSINTALSKGWNTGKKETVEENNQRVIDAFLNASAGGVAVNGN